MRPLSRLAVAVVILSGLRWGVALGADDCASTSCISMLNRSEEALFKELRSDGSVEDFETTVMRYMALALRRMRVQRSETSAILARYARQYVGCRKAAFALKKGYLDETFRTCFFETGAPAVLAEAANEITTDILVGLVVFRYCVTKFGKAGCASVEKRLKADYAVLSGVEKTIAAKVASKPGAASVVSLPVSPSGKSTARFRLERTAEASVVEVDCDIGSGVCVVKRSRRGETLPVARIPWSELSPAFSEAAPDFKGLPDLAAAAVRYEFKYAGRAVTGAINDTNQDPRSNASRLERRLFKLEELVGNRIRETGSP